MNMYTRKILLSLILLITFKYLVVAQDFYLHENGVTIICTEAEFGESGNINNITYTKHPSWEITPENASTTCTSDKEKTYGINNLFKAKTGFNEDISHWDVSVFNRMMAAFSYTDFNQDIGLWDVSNVKNMNATFSNTPFNQDISNWDVSSVENMSYMFSEAESFNQDLNKWDVSKVKNMSGMFWFTSFNKDISKWDVSNVTNMQSMFYNSTEFNQNIGEWDVSSVTNMHSMFEGASSFNQDLSGWCVTNISSEPENFATGSALTEENKPIWGTCPNAMDNRITIRDLNTYTDLVTLDETSIQNQEYKDEPITITGIVVSNPTSSGLAGYGASSDIINRIHVFIIDTSAISQGRDGMSLQIVESTQSFVDSLEKGGIYDFYGQLTFFSVTSQFDLLESPKLVGTVNDSSYVQYSELLQPRELSIDDIHSIQDNKIILTPENYMKYNAEYVSFSNVFSWVALTSTRNVWMVHNNSSKIWTWDYSLRFRNDRTDNYKSYYNFIRSKPNFPNGSGKGLFVPPISNSKLNISGFLVVHRDDNNYDNYSGETFSINPFEDGILWSKDRIKLTNGETYNGEVFNWVNDIQIIDSPYDTNEYVLEFSDFSDLAKLYIPQPEKITHSNTDSTLNVDNASFFIPYHESDFGNYQFEIKIADAEVDQSSYFSFHIDWLIGDMQFFEINLSDKTLAYEKALSSTQLNLKEIDFSDWIKFNIYYREGNIEIIINDNHQFILSNPEIGQGERNGFLRFDTNTKISFNSIEYSKKYLTQPSLSTPFNDQVNVGTLTEFTWNEVESSVSYHLQVSTDNQFSSFVFDSSKVGSTSFTLSEPLSENTTYFWRMKSISDNELRNSEWSDTLTFITGIRTSIEDELMPQEYILSQNYPNPFNPSTQIQYALPEATEVTLEVFNSVGQKVMELVNGQKSAGYHTATFDASGLSSGVYLYKLTTPSFTETKKMLLIK